MSTDIGGRAVLRPAGNVARANLRKASKPPPSPVKPPLNSPSTKISPPNSLPTTPKPLARTPPLKPNSPSKLSPHRPPIPSPVSLHQSHQESLSVSPLDLANDGPKPALTAVGGTDLPSNGSNSCEDEVSGSSAPLLEADAASCGSEPSAIRSSSISSGSKPSSNAIKSSLKGAKPSRSGSSSLSGLGKQLQSESKASSDTPHSAASRTQRTINPHIVLTKSTSEVFQRSAKSLGKAKPSSKKNLSKLGSLSFDESSLATMVAAKKAAAKEISAQRKLKVSEYGRKHGKSSRVAPEVSTVLPAPIVEPRRCKFITAQSDPAYVAYHDKEWGVPVHEDRMLFELLVLVGFQVELSWTTILHKRDVYRSVFSYFDPAAVAQFSEKHIVSLESDRSLGLPGGKVQGVVNNAQILLEVVHEFGSLDEYLWGFVNKQPMINNYRYPKQVPAKTSKAEFISKDLVKRGFRFVGPTIIYSFMQASGMTNDHLVQCFRHQECMRLPCPSGGDVLEEMPEGSVLHEDDAAHLHDLDFGLDEERVEQELACEEECHSDQQEECMHAIGLEEEESHNSNSAT